MSSSPNGIDVKKYSWRWCEEGDSCAGRTACSKGCVAAQDCSGGSRSSNGPEGHASSCIASYCDSVAACNDDGDVRTGDGSK